MSKIKKRSTPSPNNRLRAYGGSSDTSISQAPHYRGLDSSSSNSYWHSAIQLAPQETQK